MYSGRTAFFRTSKGLSKQFGTSSSLIGSSKSVSTNNSPVELPLNQYIDKSQNQNSLSLPRDHDAGKNFNSRKSHRYIGNKHSLHNNEYLLLSESNLSKDGFKQTRKESRHEISIIRKFSTDNTNNDSLARQETATDQATNATTLDDESLAKRNREAPLRNALYGMIEHQSCAEDLIYANFRDTDGNVRLNELKSALVSTGINYEQDVRLKELKLYLKKIGRYDGLLSEEQFKTAIKSNIVLVGRAMRGDFVIPDWVKFTNKLEEIYWKCKINKNGNVANYIPQLAKYNPDYWAVSMCTIDGQKFQFGDVDVPFTIQSSGKPINYAIALNALGSDITHQYVGQEPSGRLFNDLSLKIFEGGDRPKPHNPMVNSGAIVICSLLMNLINKNMKTAEKFDWVCDFYKSMAGGEHVGFNNATFLSEREVADRNYAIGFYMKENKCFPPDVSLKAVMDFYFQLCSLEVNCLTVSMMASTLANGGICPLTEKRIFDSRAVRDVLSLMHSCGMYDYSGQFAFTVGLPAKSGVSGCTMVVIPNVGGLGLFSPPLDSYGNSVRGLHFCNELVDHFNFHQYDNLRHVPHKSDPRRKRYETLSLNIICLLFAAAKGDMSAIRRYYMSGMDMSLTDYDHRTALHSAAAEGHLHIIEFLLETCHLYHEPRDRWGRRPVDDAIFCGHKHIAEFLNRWPEIKEQIGAK